MPTLDNDTTIRPVRWVGGLDGHVALIDQTLLPEELKVIRVENLETMRDAIQRLVVRGAPAIGIAAAMGVVLGVRTCDEGDEVSFHDRLREACELLRTSRPTAVNLSWALGRLITCAQTHAGRGVTRIKQALLNEAKSIRDEDAAMCRKIGEHGAHLITEGCGVLTHCNAGALATAEYGTALAPLYLAHATGRSFNVYAGETRPLLQGARLTAWELRRAGIRVTLICDSMAAVIMCERKVDLVITGADRIATNGDTGNKIGTYGLAVLAEAHRIPLYVAAPSSTFDLAVATGDAIPIEQRDPDEVRRCMGRRTAPEGVPCHNPAFDVTPAHLIRGIITERGVIEPVSRGTIAAVLGTAAT